MFRNIMTNNSFVTACGYTRTEAHRNVYLRSFSKPLRPISLYKRSGRISGFGLVVRNFLKIFPRISLFPQTGLFYFNRKTSQLPETSDLVRSIFETFSRNVTSVA